MGGEKSSQNPVNQAVIEPHSRLSANRFRFISQIEPPPMSPEMVESSKAWKEKRESLHTRMLALNKLEAVSRKSDERKAETFLAALEIGGDKKPVEVAILSSDQEKMVHEAFMAAGQTEGEQTALRESFMGSINEQEIFVGLYEQWQNEYKNDPSLHDKTIEEYVKMKGIEHIKLYRKQLIRERTNLFYDANAKTDNLTDKEKSDQKDKFYKALDLYIQANREMLAELNSLPEEEQAAQRKVLLDKFVVVMNQNGFDKTDKSKVEELFNRIVGDLEHEVAIIEGFETACGEMIQMANEGVTAEQWNERRMKALKKKAAELPEAPQQQVQPVYAGGIATDTVSGPVFTEINDIEKAGHIRFEPVPNKPNEYTIKFLSLAENELFRPNIRIVYDPPEAKDMQHARFELQDEWADPDSNDKGAPFGASPSRRIDDPRKMVGGLNSLLLNYVINKKISLRTPINAAESPNQAIKDNIMTHIAERLLMPVRMEENPLSDQQLKIFERFMTVVLRDDPNSALNALEKRIYKVKEMIDKDEDIAYMKEIFMAEGSKVRTLDELIKEIKVRKSGEQGKA